jgi:hypothetical protein
MAFKLYNRSAVKLDTDELLIEAYKDYCKHLALGLDKRSWAFWKDGKPLCIFATMDKYIEERQDVLDPIHYDSAILVGYKEWEMVVAGSAKGVNQRANPASLQMIMRNKYGWDARVGENLDEDKGIDLKTYAQALAAQREQLQEQAKGHIDSPANTTVAPA